MTKPKSIGKQNLSNLNFALLHRVTCYKQCPSKVKNNKTHTYRRARQRCFWLLAFISHPQVRNIHLPGRVISPGSARIRICQDHSSLRINISQRIYPLWYTYPLVWLRHHSSQTLYVARVKSKQLKSNVLPEALNHFCNIMKCVDIGI